MTTTINAVSGTGLTQTADGSGVVKLQSNGVTTNALAWVKFVGSNPTSTQASYNVSSVTWYTTGGYTIAFSNSLSDANYLTLCGGIDITQYVGATGTPTTSSVSIRTAFKNIGLTDSPNYANSGSTYVAIFGN